MSYSSADANAIQATNEVNVRGAFIALADAGGHVPDYTGGEASCHSDAIRLAASDNPSVDSILPFFNW